ncbi:MAG TPA: prolyl oligopeptidase family serine peptidase [Williamwhitmania sp.]|nr:prolyl oligopeptidase family serine peptidase [Williamwhitmania sp.]
MKTSTTAILLTMFCIAANAQTKFNPPATKSIPVVDTLHGVILTDDYRWLENKTDSSVVSWTKAQHDYGIEYLAATQKTHAGLREDIARYLDLDYEGPLNREGKRVFQTVKKKGDKQYKLYTILNGEKILIWDPVTLDTTGKTSTSSIAYTYDGERAAISVQKSGAEISSTYIVDTRTGKILYPPLENIFGYQWTKDQQHAYFTVRSQEDVDKQQPLKSYYWKVGDPIDKATFIGTTTDAKNNFYIYDSRYSDVTFYGEGDFYSNSLYMRKTGTFDKGALIYESKEFNAYPEAIGDKLYILTNDNAPNFKLMVADRSNAEYKSWKVLIPESGTVMQSYVVTKNGIIVQDKKDIQSRLTLYDLSGKRIKQVELPEIGNVGGISYDREEDSVYVSLNTFTSTSKTFVASPSNFKWRLYYQRELPVDMSNIVGEIKFYTSKDSTRVPVFVVHRKDMQLDGNNPVLITAYGGFNYGIEPQYYGFYAAFINRGGVVVEAGIRGGDEYGEKWHQGGMLGNKQNCFDDFNSCTEWLIREKYTNTSRIVAMGGSNGGLLMGAIAVQRPDLYKAIVCEVPLLDMIRYHKFLIARYWIPEYGSSDNEKDFRWLLRYSPYQNIRMGVNVPAMLVTAGAHDSRVDPMNAKKFVAALQNNPGQVSPIILHMDYDSGHGSGQSTAQSIDNWDFVFEFIMNQLNM